MSDERFDVLVIGGGINGVAIARECARGGKVEFTSGHLFVSN